MSSWRGRKPGYLIWDFDGTLGYREGAWTGCLLEAIRRDLPECAVTLDDLRPHLRAGFPWHTPEQAHPDIQAAAWWDGLNPVFERAFIAVGLDAARAAALAGACRQLYLDPRQWRLFADTRPALDALSARGWRHILLSNHVPELPAILRHLQIDGYFGAVFNSAETGYEKPHREAFLRALAAAPGAAAVWMIGDNMTADIAGAAAAGIPGILVRHAHVDAPCCCADLAQVVALLAG